MRSGIVMRILPHGTVMVWEDAAGRSFPYYGRPNVGVGDRVRFELNHNNMIIEFLQKEEEPLMAADFPTYKYSEDKSIAEFAAYIKNTYGEHYAGQNNIQSFDVWEARNADPTDTHVDTALKYLFRYGKKNGYNRKDIMKTMHYCLLLLHYHNKFHSDKGEIGVEDALNPPYEIKAFDANRLLCEQTTHPGLAPNVLCGKRNDRY